MVFISNYHGVLAIHRQYSPEGEVSYRYETGTKIDEPLTKIPVSKKQLEDSDKLADKIIEAILDDKESSVSDEDFRRLVKDTIYWRDDETKIYPLKRIRIKDIPTEEKNGFKTKKLKWGVITKGRNIRFKIKTTTYSLNKTDSGVNELIITDKEIKFINLRISKDDILKKFYYDIRVM
jgi:hypothetical protein